MRLVKASVTGFGRIASADINLDRRVIAIVGPNEAGKSTLLDALTHIETRKLFPAARRTRGRIPGLGDDVVVVELSYTLEEDDLKSISDIELERPPQTMRVGRKAGDKDNYAAVYPEPEKPVAALNSAVDELKRAINQDGFVAFETPTPDVDSEPDPERVQLAVDVEALTATLTSLDSDVRQVAVGNAQEIGDVVASCDQFDIDGSVAEALRDIAAWCEIPDPEEEVRNRLYSRRPQALLFSAEDRDLQSSYVLVGDGANLAKSLHNLCALAELDLDALVATYEANDSATRDTMIIAANKRLAEVFAEQWNQSKLNAHIKIEGQTLFVTMLQDGAKVTLFDERSAGVKMFVALSAFLAATHPTLPPVLLIDEAETHLHINAQQDLVNAFMNQAQAAKIIYTTHSPACLPPDLGTAIRAVIPDPNDPEVSAVESSFWSREGVGYSPLLMAMGAGVAAFSAVRCAVVAEGASEMILLPRLIREASGVDEVEYQIVPGLAEVSNETLGDLDFVAAKVAFLVDGDTGGKRHKKRLKDAGVPDSRILALDVPGIENLLDPAIYLATVVDLIRETTPDFKTDTLPQLGDATSTSWATDLEAWSKNAGVRLPGKRVVAEKLVQLEERLIGEPGKLALTLLDQQLRGALELSCSECAWPRGI